MKLRINVNYFGTTFTKTVESVPLVHDVKYRLKFLDPFLSIDGYLYFEALSETWQLDFVRELLNLTRHIPEPHKQTLLANGFQLVEPTQGAE